MKNAKFFLIACLFIASQSNAMEDSQQPALNSQIKQQDPMGDGPYDYDTGVEEDFAKLWSFLCTTFAPEQIDAAIENVFSKDKDSEDFSDQDDGMGTYPYDHTTRLGDLLNESSSSGDAKGK